MMTDGNVHRIHSPRGLAGIDPFFFIWFAPVAAGVDVPILFGVVLVAVQVRWCPAVVSQMVGTEETSNDQHHRRQSLGEQLD